MPSWIVPSDTHGTGDSGHTTDHNHVADDLTLIATAFPGVTTGAASTTHNTLDDGSGNATIAGVEKVIATAGTNALIVSAGGSATEAGAFVVQTGSGGFAGVYDTGNSLYYGISRALPAPSGTAVLGGYYKGLGVGGATNATATPIFGVLTSTQSGEGTGNTAFTVTDSNVVQTFRNTLDDGSGNASIFALLTLHFGSSTANYAPVITPAFANGTAAQLSDTARDYMVYLAVTTSGTATTVAIGPTSTPANTILPSSSVTAGQLISFRLPAGWYVKWAGTTTAIATQTAIGC